MPKKILSQNNFNGGELSPELYGHTNLDVYKTGLQSCKNAVLSPRGPVMRRKGFDYISEVKTSSKATRLIPFKISQTKAYILEVGDLYIRFYADGARLGAPYEVVSPFTEAQLFEITYVPYGNTLYLQHYSHGTYALKWTADTTWELAAVTFLPPALYEDGYKPATTLTPAATSGSSINFTAGSAIFLDGDIGRQFVNLSGTGKAIITSITSTTVAVADIVENFPNTSAIASQSWKMDLSPIVKIDFTGVNEGSTANIRSKYVDSAKGPTLTITGITKAAPGVVTTSTNHNMVDGDNVIIQGVVGMTQVNDRQYAIASISGTTFSLRNPETFANVDTTNFATYSSAGIARKTFEDVEKDAFRSADVGNYLVGNDGVAKVSSQVSAKEIKVNIQKAFSTSSATAAWSFQQPVWDATNGYPRAITLHGQRMYLGSSSAFPQKLWASETGIFDSMGIGSQDTDGLDLDISSAEVNRISWMVSLNDSLLIGTEGAEMAVNSGATSGPITPTNASIHRFSQEGSYLQQPQTLGGELLYVQKSGTKLMAVGYDFMSDGFKPVDLFFLANHLPENAGGIVEVATSSDPIRQIFAILEDGTMAVGTYVKDQKVLGWSLWDTPGSFESVATLATGLNTEIWCVVNRTINGTTKRYVERYNDTQASDRLSVYSDCADTYSLPKTISGITKANPAVVTSTAHGFSNGDSIKIVDVVGMTEVNGRTFTVANVAANTFELSGENSTSYTTYVSSGEAHELVSTISGLSHLEAETVQIKVDGTTHADKTVSGGSITLDSPSYEVTVGLEYETEVTLLPPTFDVGIGDMVAQPVRWINPHLNLYQSALPLVNGRLVPARVPSDPMDGAVSLYSGNIEYGSFAWEEGGDLSITSSYPLPLMLLSITGTTQSGVK